MGPAERPLDLITPVVAPHTGPFGHAVKADRREVVPCSSFALMSARSAALEASDKPSDNGPRQHQTERDAPRHRYLPGLR
jgi:hypothetical protein